MKPTGCPEPRALSLTASGSMLGYQWRVGGPDPQRQPVCQRGTRNGG
jgi:hypothetical protein